MFNQQPADIKFCILASGSTGNMTYVETEKSKLLIDCGFSGKTAERLLSQINRSPAELDGILVTHEHNDHIKGVGVLSRRYNLDVYANEGTWQAMSKKIGKIDQEHQHHFFNNRTKIFNDLDVSSFGVSHDAADPQFYTFQKGGKRFVMLTDTGYVSDRMRGYLKNADAYLFESNHDLAMLRMGSYPWHLKQRIISDKGHLSNEDGARALAEIVGDKTKHVFLGHLSKENNMKSIAYNTAEDILRRKDTGVNDQFQLHNTDPDQPSQFISL